MDIDEYLSTRNDVTPDLLLEARMATLGKFVGASTTYLSDEGFDAFYEILDAPMPRAALDLFNTKSVWE